MKVQVAQIWCGKCGRVLTKIPSYDSAGFYIEDLLTCDNRECKVHGQFWKVPAIELELDVRPNEGKKRALDAERKLADLKELAQKALDEWDGDVNDIWAAFSDMMKLTKQAAEL